MSLEYPKNLRLCLKRDFNFLRMESLVLRSNLANIYYVDRGLLYPRFAIGVPKSVANAVLRNRIKRLTREFIRKNWKSIPTFDYSIQFHFRSRNSKFSLELLKNLTASDVGCELHCLLN